MELVLLKSEAFLFGIGGGAALRRTCGLLWFGTAGPGKDDVTGELL